LWGITKIRRAVPVVLQIGAKYVRHFADYEGDFEGEIPCMPATKRDVRRFFGTAFIAEDDEIPDELLQPLTPEPVGNPDDILK